MKSKICVLLSNADEAAISRAALIASATEELNSVNESKIEFKFVHLHLGYIDKIYINNTKLASYTCDQSEIDLNNCSIVVMDFLSYAYVYANDPYESTVSLWCSYDNSCSAIPELSTSLIHSLIESTQDTVFAVDEEDSHRWSSAKGSATEYIQIEPIFFNNSKTFEPLIEKSSLPRVLIDSTDFRSITHLKEAFISLENQKCEVWCITNNTLYSWMRPDMLFDSVFPGEEGIFYTSVDLVILNVFDASSQEKALALGNKGIIPICIDDNRYSKEIKILVSDEYSSDVGNLTSRIKKALDGINVDKKNGLDIKSSVQNAFGDFQNVRNSREKVRELLTKDSKTVSKSKLNRNLVNSIIIDFKHNNIVLKRPALVKPVIGNLVCLRGWVLSLENHLSCDLLVVKDENLLEPVVNKTIRHDVNDKYNVQTDVELGFILKYIEIGNYKSPDVGSIPILALENNTLCGSFVPYLRGSVDTLDHNNNIKIINKKEEIIILSNDKINGLIEERTVVPGFVFSIDPANTVSDKLRFRIEAPVDTSAVFLMCVEKSNYMTTYEASFTKTENGMFQIPGPLVKNLSDATTFHIWVKDENVVCTIID